MDSFELLVARYEDRIYRYLLRRTGNSHDAEDLTQAAFLTAFRRIDLFDPGRSFPAWLFTVARRIGMSHWRAAARREQPVETPQGIEARMLDPAAALEAREERERLWACARRTLSSDQFTALWLRYEDDRSVREVAHMMGKAEIYARVLLHRGRTRLVKALRAEWELEPGRASGAGAPGRLP